MEQPATNCRAISAGSTTTTPTDSDVMTLAEAAAFLKCDPATVKRQAKVLRMPHKRVGALWRFYRPALVAWMQDDEAA